MSFDKDDGRPLINTEKRTTRVNIWMAVAVITFIIAGILVAVLIDRTPPLGK